MSTYYKAVRPDGTDFRTGTLLHEVGATVVHPQQCCTLFPNDPSTYLSTSVEPAETLIGGSWPCRLFEVQPCGDVAARTDGRFPHKRGMQAYTVERELPAHMALGPNGLAVAALIERASRLTRDECYALAAAWNAAWNAARNAAMDAAWDAAWNAARNAAMDAAWDAAMDAARDAACALVVRDLISEAHFDALYGPWAAVMEA